MAKKDKAKKAKSVQSMVKIKKVKTVVPIAKVKVVSPLAPRGGFPRLPVIDGVRFAAVEAGVKYANRTDLMLVELAPGTTMAGCFTRSSTRSAPGSPMYFNSRRAR